MYIRESETSPQSNEKIDTFSFLKKRNGDVSVEILHQLSGCEASQVGAHTSWSLVVQHHIVKPRYQELNNP
jgi:hypothetical protein